MLHFFSCVFAHNLPSVWIISSFAAFQGQILLPPWHQSLWSTQHQISFCTNFCISVTLIILKSLIPCVIIGQAYAIFLARVKALFGPGSCPSNSFIPPKGLQSACLLCQGSSNVPLVVNGLHHLCMWKPRHYSPLHMLIEEQWCGESK